MPRIRKRAVQSSESFHSDIVYPGDSDSLSRMKSQEAAPLLPSKVALRRLLQIHDRLNLATRGQRRVNCSTLAEELGCSTKTIQRDLEYLRDDLKLPVEYDFGEKAFAYTREQVVFPLGPDLTPDERIALVVARQSLEVFEGVNFGQDLRSAFNKITGGLMGESGFHLEERLDRFISVRTPGAGRVDQKVFRAVRLALLNQVELQLTYQAKGKAGQTPRRLQPLHLACIENRWLLVARDLDKDQIRTYVLARCGQPRVTQTRFERPQDFDPSAYFAGSFGAWTGTGTTVVKLRISANGAHHVFERTWHPTQKEIRLPGGALEVHFALSDLNDLTRWILGFGSDCEVLEPKELRAAIAEEGRKMAAGSGIR